MVTSVELVKACVVLDMFKLLSDREICSVKKCSALLVVLTLRCSKIVLVFLAGLLQYFLPNMIVGNIVKVDG